MYPLVGQLNDWEYSDYFLPNDQWDGRWHPVITKIETYLKDNALDQHPFFELAASNRGVLRLWVTQELVMTNSFSQIVLRAASNVRNVHVRSILCEVASGEHGRFRRGGAFKSHPWLLHKLGKSLDVAESDVGPLGPTRRLIERLASTADRPLEALAFIGVGNERLIIPEYTAIKRCFEALLPGGDYEPFLDANLTEDEVHSKLCFDAASILIAAGGSAERYLEMAIESIECRFRYFDELQAIGEEASN